MDILDTDIKYIKGVGPVRSALLAEELHVFSLRDLLYLLPYKYIDRSMVHKISDVYEGMPYVQLRGHIVNVLTEGEGWKRRLTAIFTDGTGYAELVWFNGVAQQLKKLALGVDYLLLGKPTDFGGRLSIAHPELEKASEVTVEQGRFEPHYHLTEKLKKRGISSHWLRDTVQRGLQLLQDRPLSDPLPPHLLQRHALLGLREALHKAHAPASADESALATARFKYEELFFLQLDILRYARARTTASAGYVFPHVGRHFHLYYKEHLPFSRTEAQKRVIREIRADLCSGRQMNRLLQGDVGSGKTMVALLIALLAIDNGYQCCLMAPTEILARQHFEVIQASLAPLGLQVALLTSNVRGVERERTLLGVGDGRIHLLIGTHALIEPEVVFCRLGLAIIDEQHRFGVKQRAALWQKSVKPPHVLVMTATPIPRTLAMTVYGDLDVSVIDQLPPGRKPVCTVHYRQADRARLYEGLRYQLQLGRQVYVVYPLIKENPKQQLRDAETGFRQLSDHFPDLRVGLVHGQMKPALKDEVMQAFKKGEIHLLVSTTVIEVGVNVPNASVMVIENAERFGLAQLHQLRGRVGRGADQSYCVLVTADNLSADTQKRMAIMTGTTDGFEIAEEDMKLRGPGDLEGTAQSGLPFELRVANIVKDRDLMEQARNDAAEVLETDPAESLPAYAHMWAHLRKMKRFMQDFSAIS